MEKNCNNCEKVNGCTMKAYCKGHRLNYCRFYEVEAKPVIEENEFKTKLKNFEDAARPLIKWLCENEHPMVTAIITTTSCELLEGKCCNHKIYDYVKD
jgi:hypothetical protein